MKKFIQTATNQQMSADTIDDANIKFRTCCNICVSNQLKMNCDKCIIKTTHNLTVAALNAVNKNIG